MSTKPRQEFQVERILDRRLRDNRVQYFLKWKGYSIEESTWEPLQNMRRAVKAVVRFQKEAKETLLKKRERRNKVSQYLGRPEKKRNLRQGQRRGDFDPKDAILIEDETEIIEKKEYSLLGSLFGRSSEADIMMQEMTPQIQCYDSQLSCSVGTQMMIQEEPPLDKTESDKADLYLSTASKPQVQRQQMFTHQIDNNSLTDLEDDMIYIVKFRNGLTRNYTGRELKRKSPRKINSILSILRANAF